MARKIISGAIADELGSDELIDEITKKVIKSLKIKVKKICDDKLDYETALEVMELVESGDEKSNGKKKVKKQPLKEETMTIGKLKDSLKRLGYEGKTLRAKATKLKVSLSKTPKREELLKLYLKIKGIKEASEANEESEEETSEEEEKVIKKLVKKVKRIPVKKVKEITDSEEEEETKVIKKTKKESSKKAKNNSEQEIESEPKEEAKTETPKKKSLKKTEEEPEELETTVLEED